MASYEKHIFNTISKKSYCNEDLNGEFKFINVEHAIHTRLDNQRLTVCKKCTEVINKILKS